MSSDAVILDPRSGMQALIDALDTAGYRVLGPVLRDGVIVYDDVVSESAMPTGVRVEQGAGRWRVFQDARPERFSWTPGADSWKRFVFPARSEVLRIRRTDGSWTTGQPAAPDRPLALLGARDCEVRALGVLDTVMLGPNHPDARYAQRRADAFVVAVTCGEPSSTCWCTSMGGGPQPHDGFDLRITELSDHAGHRLLVQPGSDRGEQIMAVLPGSDAHNADIDSAAHVVQRSVDRLAVRLPGAELPALLAGSELHPHWDDVAARCLSCSNCTMVCPTCFCSSFSDHTSLDNDEAFRTQEWASCFQLDHSYLGGRPVRATTAQRYRQWLTHKLQTWTAQMGTTGCVGCGRCTTWCPAGIDIIEEARAVIGSQMVAARLQPVDVYVHPR